MAISTRPSGLTVTLVHSRGALRVRRRQRRGGQHTIEVTENRLGLVQAEAVMFEDRNATERMQRQMFG